MTSESAEPKADQAKAITRDADGLPAGDLRARSAQKGAATIRRHKEERRADKLDHIRSQIADGSLVVRQMTAGQLKTASRDARRTLARNEERR